MKYKTLLRKLKENNWNMRFDARELALIKDISEITEVNGIKLKLEEIKKVKIDENELWVNKCKSNPLSSQEFLVSREAFEARIKKLKEV